MSKCTECDWYEPTVGDLCGYCYKKSTVITNNANEIAEVCRKCDRGYKYTMEQVETVNIGEDICRECVSMRRMMRGQNFSLDELRQFMRIFPLS